MFEPHPFASSVAKLGFTQRAERQLRDPDDGGHSQSKLREFAGPAGPEFSAAHVIGLSGTLQLAAVASTTRNLCKLPRQQLLRGWSNRGRFLRREPGGGGPTASDFIPVSEISGVQNYELHIRNSDSSRR